MHLRNSCTRSTSSWYIRYLPSASRGLRLERRGCACSARSSSDTSVTRSLITGNVLSGWTVIVSSGSKMFMRVMHASLGLPLISMLHEPHLPALQFQRSARSLACCAWMRCSTSSTTMPGSTSTSYVLNSPPFASPRQTRNVRFAIDGAPLVVVARRAPTLPASRSSIFAFAICDEVARRRRLRAPSRPPSAPSVPLRDDDVVLQPLVALAREVDARVRAAALLAHQRARAPRPRT